MAVPNPKGDTINLWGKCPLYGSNATGRLIFQEIHYQFLHYSMEMVPFQGINLLFERCK